MVTDAAGKAAKIEWLGRELDAESAKSSDPAITLFFEIAIQDGLNGKMLKHTVFSHLFRDQINLLQLQSDTRKVEIQFTGDDARKNLAIPN